MTSLLLDLIQDLRGKRLWPVAVALLAATAAVPLVLLKPAQSPTDSGPAIASGSGPSVSTTSSRPFFVATGRSFSLAAASRPASRSTARTSRGPSGSASDRSTCIWPIGPAAPTTTATPPGRSSARFRASP